MQSVLNIFILSKVISKNPPLGHGNGTSAHPLLGVSLPIAWEEIHHRGDTLDSHMGYANPSDTTASMCPSAHVLLVSCSLALENVSF